MLKKYENGNIVVYDRYNRRFIGRDGYSGTLTANAPGTVCGTFYVMEVDNTNEIYNKALNRTPKDSTIETPLDEENVRIRQFTPKECWRLMGFGKRQDDGTYDDSAFESAQAVNSNTQLYKQAGNSIVVDVLEAIFKEMIEC